MIVQIKWNIENTLFAQYQAHSKYKRLWIIFSFLSTTVQEET